MSAKREGMARSWEVETREFELPNFLERTQGKNWAEKVGQNTWRLKTMFVVCVENRTVVAGTIARNYSSFHFKNRT